MTTKKQEEVCRVICRAMNESMITFKELGNAFAKAAKITQEMERSFNVVEFFK